MAQLLSTCFLVFISVQLVKSSGVFELKVHSFTTTSSSVCKQSRDCQVFFRVCLNYTQDVISYRLACSDGTGLTGTLSTGQSFINTSAPITVPFNLKWLSINNICKGTMLKVQCKGKGWYGQQQASCDITNPDVYIHLAPGNMQISLMGTVLVIIEAWSAESSNDQPIENLNNMIGHFVTKTNLTIGQKWSLGEHLAEQSELLFSYRVVCDEFYYGDDCTDFCRSRDDPFGHFTCDDAGNRICLPGWNGDYCAEPICLSGCSEEHGYCEAPGQCKCFLGWQGPHCDECILYPGCLHGTCKQPWQCICKEGWGGLLCNRDLKF